MFSLSIAYTKPKICSNLPEIRMYKLQNFKQMELQVCLANIFGHYSDT